MPLAAASTSSQALACLEVWGGNEPVDKALRVPGLDVWVYAVPFENASAGGDVHFISSCGSGRIARLVVADVAGHGASVAETARTLRSLIYRYMNYIDQRKIVISMNEEFTRLAEVGRFATAVVMTYFSPQSELSICNAGHPPPLIYKASTNTWRYLEAGALADNDDIENIPLGILADAGYQQFFVGLSPGDLILCYTDSLVEAVCPDQSLLGAQRLLELTRAIAPSKPAEFIHHLLANIAACGATPNDDVTLLLSRCTGFARGAGSVARLGAQLKFMRQMFTFQRNMPWPEWTFRNIGGMLIPAFSRRKR